MRACLARAFAFMQIFFTSGKSSADMAFRFVYVQDGTRLSGKRGIYQHKARRDVLVHSGFAYAKGFGCLSDCSVIFNDIHSNIDCSFFNIILHNLKRFSF